MWLPSTSKPASPGQTDALPLLPDWTAVCGLGSSGFGLSQDSVPPTWGSCTTSAPPESEGSPGVLVFGAGEQLRSRRCVCEALQVEVSATHRGSPRFPRGACPPCPLSTAPSGCSGWTCRAKQQRYRHFLYEPPVDARTSCPGLSEYWASVIPRTPLAQAETAETSRGGCGAGMGCITWGEICMLGPGGDWDGP